MNERHSIAIELPKKDSFEDRDACSQCKEFLEINFYFKKKERNARQRRVGLVQEQINYDVADEKFYLENYMLIFPELIVNGVFVVCLAS